MIMLLAERRSWAPTSSPGEATFRVGANCDRKAVRGVIELQPGPTFHEDERELYRSRSGLFQAELRRNKDNTVWLYFVRP
jgi:hypothetical protein